MGLLTGLCAIEIRDFLQKILAVPRAVDIEKELVNEDVSRMNFWTNKNWIWMLGLLVGGLAIGLCIPIQQIRNVVSDIFELDETPEKAEEEAHEDIHIEITETAQKSLGLIVRRAAIDSYTSTYDIPAKLRTLPSANAIPLSSRFSGMVRNVYVSEGQSVKPGDPLFEIELTGERISKAQTELLLAIRRNDNLVEELNRLAPLVQQGGLANKRSLELQYEQKQVLAEIDAKQQELYLLGFDASQVDKITSSKKLIREVTVHVPENLLGPQVNLPNSSFVDKKLSFILESLTAKPGSMVSLGDPLCVLSFHEILIVEGHAFERDLAMIKDRVVGKQSVSVSVGNLGTSQLIRDCEIAYVGNHARDNTNTFPFYVYLSNEMQLGAGVQTPTYITWRWKPGQLGHIEIPREKFENVIVLPRDAVAENGLSRVVFEWKGQVEHDHPHDEEEEHEHEHADEYEPIEVEVLFMNNEVAIVNPDGKLEPGTKIAFNCATQLLFSMQSGGGHGHDHGHEH